MVHSKWSINGNHNHQSPVPLLILLGGKGSSFFNQPQGTEACFWTKFLSVSSKVNSEKAPRVATKHSLSWAETKPERSLERENQVYHQKEFGAWGGREKAYLFISKTQILLPLVKGKFTPFEISEQSETLNEFLIASKLRNNIRKNKGASWKNRQGKRRRKMCPTCFCLWLDNLWGSGTCQKENISFLSPLAIVIRIYM